jgi:hypothetical protein
MSKVVQEKFGEAIITAIREFAKSDLRTVDQLKACEFCHIGDANLKDSLAETFYGARWIYKLGLALLVRNSEQMAHVRTQVMDYGAVCEGLLSDVILHALQTNRMTGKKYCYADPTKSRGKIKWQVQNKLEKLNKQSFFWHIEVAFEEKMIDDALYESLHKMRKERNTVHIRARTHKAFLGTSKFLFNTVLETIRQTKAWRAANP